MSGPEIPSAKNTSQITCAAASDSDLRTGKRAWLFSRCQSLVTGKHERWMSHYRDKLLSGVSGRILEIGPGSGPNFKYVSPDVEWHGVEPNAYMHPGLLEEAAEHGISGVLHSASADELPFPDAHFDTVIGTLVLCSVDRIDAALSEILRVLRPGGQFHFLEHVGAKRGTTRRQVQGLITPCWRLVGGGCRPNKDTLAHIQQASFSSVDAESFSVPIPIVWPHIAGTAAK